MNHQGTGLFPGWSGSFIVGVVIPWEVQGGVGAWLCLGVSCHWGWSPDLLCKVGIVCCTLGLGTNALVPSRATLGFG